MTININIDNAGAKTRALAAQLDAMGKDRDRRYSDQDLRDTAIGTLITIVGELEQEIADMRRTNEAAKTKAAFDDLQYRSYGGGSR